MVDFDVTTRDLGRRIAEARKARGWTQEYLAERVGLHSASMSNVEAGKRKPSLKLAAKLASLLGVKSEEFVYPAIVLTFKPEQLELARRAVMEQQPPGKLRPASATLPQKPRQRAHTGLWGNMLRLAAA